MFAGSRALCVLCCVPALRCANPIHHLLAAAGVLAALPAQAQPILAGREFFPQLISAPFHHGLTVVFTVAAALAALAGAASLLRGGRPVPDEPAGRRQYPKPSTTAAHPRVSSIREPGCDGLVDHW